MTISACLYVSRLPARICRALDDDRRIDGRHWYVNRDLRSESQRVFGRKIYPQGDFEPRRSCRGAQISVERASRQLEAGVTSRSLRKA